jgi:hypothetical protein
MHHGLAQDVGGSTRYARYARYARQRTTEDALDPIRGILVGTLISIFGFWLPLALALSR